MMNLSEEAIADLINDNRLREKVSGKRVLVLGADGFLGSYTALALHRLGASVTLFSRRKEPLLAHLELSHICADMLAAAPLEAALQNQDIVFDLAGSSSGVESNRNAADSLNQECAPHLNLFQIASQQATPPLVVFCSTRTVYGKPQSIPVDETHALKPQSIYAVHKRTLEDYLQTFHQVHKLPYIIFRLSNPYGPFLGQLGKAYGILNQFIYKGVLKEALPIFGKGDQLRDYIYIEDVVRAFIQSACNKNCTSQIFNLGGPTPISVDGAAKAITERCPEAKIDYKSWPDDYLKVETGDYLSDCGKLESALNWKPSTSFENGLERTLIAYREQMHSPSDRKLELTQSTIAQPTFQWAGKRVLVTGAGGALGSFMCNTLIHADAQVIALHRRSIPEALAQHPNVTALQIDLTDNETQIAEVFQKHQPEIIFHFAATPDGKEVPELMNERLNVNTMATLTLLQAANTHLDNLHAFIFGDSCKVYGNAPVPHKEDTVISPDSSYAISKSAAWSLCKIFHRDHQLPVASLRPTLIYGPQQGYNLFSFLASCIKEKKTEINLAGGTQTRDPLFIADATRAYLLAAEHIDSIQGRSIPISGGQEIQVSELSRNFVSSAQSTATVSCDPQKIRPGEIMRSLCDNRETLNLINWEPIVPLKNGLSVTAEYLLAKEQKDIEAYWHKFVVDSLSTLETGKAQTAST